MPTGILCQLFLNPKQFKEVKKMFGMKIFIFFQLNMLIKILNL